MDVELVENMLAIAEPNTRSLIFSMMDSLSHVEFTKLDLFNEGKHQSPMYTHMFIKRFLSDIELSNPLKT